MRYRINNPHFLAPRNSDLSQKVEATLERVKERAPDRGTIELATAALEFLHAPSRPKPRGGPVDSQNGKMLGRAGPKLTAFCSSRRTPDRGGSGRRCAFRGRVSSMTSGISLTPAPCYASPETRRSAAISGSRRRYHPADALAAAPQLRTHGSPATTDLEETRHTRASGRKLPTLEKLRPRG
jgi:hypothetical protein